MNTQYEEVKWYSIDKKVLLNIFMSGLSNMIGKGQSDGLYNLNLLWTLLIGQ